MDSIVDFIRANIKLREHEILSDNPKPYQIDIKCLKLLDNINLVKIELLVSLGSVPVGMLETQVSELGFEPTNALDNILYRISSKSFDDITGKIISNRVCGLHCILAGINYKTGKKFNNINWVQGLKHFLIALYIISGQVFSDGNHRTSYQYLISIGTDKEKAVRTIKMIDTCGKKKQIDWSNIHEFIQKLINNLTEIISDKNEQLVFEKIENFFI